MRNRVVVGLLTGLLAVAGVACSEENPTSELEDVSPELEDAAEDAETEEAGDAASIEATESVEATES